MGIEYCITPATFDALAGRSSVIGKGHGRRRQSGRSERWRIVLQLLYVTVSAFSDAFTFWVCQHPEAASDPAGPAATRMDVTFSVTGCLLAAGYAAISTVEALLQEKRATAPAGA